MTDDDKYAEFEKLAPGAAAAARKGEELAQRAIEHGCQTAGASFVGVLEGLSETASIGQSWFGRIAKGIAG